MERNTNWFSLSTKKKKKKKRSSQRLKHVYENETKHALISSQIHFKIKLRKKTFQVKSKSSEAPTKLFKITSWPLYYCYITCSPCLALNTQTTSTIWAKLGQRDPADPGEGSHCATHTIQDKKSSKPCRSFSVSLFGSDPLTTSLFLLVCVLFVCYTVCSFCGFSGFFGTGFWWVILGF
jgi:hypothetical protein